MVHPGCTPGGSTTVTASRAPTANVGASMRRAAVSVEEARGRARTRCPHRGLDDNAAGAIRAPSAPNSPVHPGPLLNARPRAAAGCVFAGSPPQSPASSARAKSSTEAFGDRTGHPPRTAVTGKASLSPPASPASTLDEAEIPCRSSPRLRSSTEVMACTEVPVSRACAGKPIKGQPQSGLTTLGVLKPPQLSLLQRYLSIQQGGGSTMARAVAEAVAARTGLGDAMADNAGECCDGCNSVACTTNSSPGNDANAKLVVVTPKPLAPHPVECAGDFLLPVVPPARGQQVPAPPVPSTVPRPALSMETKRSQVCLKPSAQHAAIQTDTAQAAPSAPAVLLRARMSCDAGTSIDGMLVDSTSEQVGATSAPTEPRTSRLKQSSERRPISSEEHLALQASSKLPASSPSRSPRRLSQPHSPTPSASAPWPPRSPEVLHGSPPQLRSQVRRAGSLRSSGRTACASWSGPIADGYYAPSMFDVLDSVESDLTRTKASGAADADAMRVQCAMDLARLQRELASVERQLCGRVAVGDGSSAGAALAGHLSLAHSSGGADLSAGGWPLASPARPPASSRAALAWADAAASAPPRRSREFDLLGVERGGGKGEGPRSGRPQQSWDPGLGHWREGLLTAASPPAPFALPASPAPPAPPRLDEIDDVLALLRKSPHFA